MVLLDIILIIMGISFLIFIFGVAYKAAVEDGTPGCLYILIAAAIITLIIILI